MSKKQPTLAATAVRSASKPNKIVPVRLELPEAHHKQYEMITAFEQKGARFVVGACGTKFGKTFGCSLRLVTEAWNNRHSLNWWVAPTFSHSEMAYDTVKNMLPDGSYRERRADLKLIVLTPDGKDWSEIEFKSGDKESSLRGFGVDFFIVDEAARIKEESFISVMTTVTQTMGRGIVISTPKGRGWFWDVYQRGEKLDERGVSKFGKYNPDPFPEWYSIRLPTWENPHVPAQSIRDAQRNLPEDVFRQEFGALFLDDTAGVFRGVSDCIRGTLLIPPMPGRHYVMGVDLARLRDYSVMVVMDQQARHVVYVERFNKISWELQMHKIVQIAKRYNARVCMDSTGLGDPIVERLQFSGVSIEPYKLTGTVAKQQLIDKLRVNIEEQNISYPENPFTLPMLDELRSYEYTFTEGGKIQYSSPRNKHDDTVIALALANWVVDTIPNTAYHMRYMRGV